MNTILQIPMKKELRDKAAAKAEELGFSSLQESVRLFLSGLAKGEIDVRFETTERLSPKQAKRYEEMVAAVELGKVKTKTFPTVSSLVKHLSK